MNDDEDDIYGDTDPNNIPDDDAAADQNASAGDGMPGYPVGGSPGWRAGAFGSGNGLLGMARVSDLVARPGDTPAPMLQFGTDQASAGSDPRLMLAANPKSSAPTLASDGREAYPMPKAYIPDGHGGVQLRPDFAAAHPGATDFGGMAKEIDWPRMGKALTDILNGVANAKIDDWVEDLVGIPSWADLPKLGTEVWKAQDEANKPGGERPRGADRATNGLP